ncbi:hepatocellular carcinoma-associated antigen 59-domain-containing protein [Armillaria luteobubalina]|uniref:Hepatocellular carcinoma-associated antigen 59-domain-containing protein n=1 Tax=Armillaria luteobubalina TaxID=153913 RepID=A0AA39TSW4_9AGAR|nr:hepatocellular carcinoma-associated antigen 59-domain-containing protein [Armillaria luteobubalina]
MIKKKSRPQPRVREVSPESEDKEIEEEGDEKLPLSDLIELRRLRKLRQGIDATKLNKGDTKKKRKLPVEGVQEQGGLRKGAVVDPEEEDDEERDARARRVVRANNFTQQTNALDVDKHMMAYIEENLKIRSHPRDESEDKNKPMDPQEALYHISDRWKVEQQKPTADDGSVTNSISMLTAIPEVDLGMDARLKNIEDTEKAKRVVAEGKQDRRPTNNDEAHLAANRFYRPNLKSKSDADIMRDAKLEAMGLPTPEDRPQRSNDKPQMATDELVMERFKKRMRK